MIFKYPTGQLYFCRAQQNTGMTAYPKHARNTPCFRQHIAGSLAVNRHSFPVVVSLYPVVLRSSTRRFDTATSPRIKGTGKRPAERMYRRRQPVPFASGQTYRAAKPGSPPAGILQHESADCPAATSFTGYTRVTPVCRSRRIPLRMAQSGTVQRASGLESPGLVRLHLIISTKEQV